MLAGCAQAIKTVPVEFTASPGAEIVMLEKATVALPTGYKRTISNNTQWKKAGQIPYGEVYRATGTIFTIEGRDVHEAYLVLNDKRALVGFYLPGESKFSQLTQPIQLKTKEKP